LGEVYRPEDVVSRRRGKPISDLTPTPVPEPIIPISLEHVIQEIKSMKVEIAKIKNVLRAHGIPVE
jgi:hypothetical protein